METTTVSHSEHKAIVGEYYFLLNVRKWHDIITPDIDKYVKDFEAVTGFKPLVKRMSATEQSYRISLPVYAKNNKQ